MGGVTTADQPRQPQVQVVPPDQVLRRARPLPQPEDLVIHDIPDDKWAAFQRALAER
jgi:hypothetical protein